LIVALKSLRRKRPSWAVRGSTLIRRGHPGLPDLKILHRDQEVKNVTVSRILFWNRGTETIVRQNIPEHGQLTIRAKEGVNLLNVEVLQDTSGGRQFEHSEDDAREASKLDFEYLEPNQGVVLQVEHTGNSPWDVSVSGHVIGGGDPVLRRVRVISYLPLPTSAEFDRRLGPRARRRITYGVALAGPALFLIMALALALLNLVLFETPALRIMSYVFSSVAGAIGISGIAYTFWEYSGNRVPTGLEIYEDDRQIITAPQAGR